MMNWGWGTGVMRGALLGQSIRFGYLERFQDQWVPVIRFENATKTYLEPGVGLANAGEALNLKLVHSTFVLRKKLKRLEYNAR